MSIYHRAKFQSYISNKSKDNKFRSRTFIDYISIGIHVRNKTSLRHDHCFDA